MNGRRDIKFDVGLPNELEGKITVNEWAGLGIDRLQTSDRTDIIDVLDTLHANSSKKGKGAVLRLVKGLVDDLVEIAD